MTDIGHDGLGMGLIYLRGILSREIIRLISNIHARKRIYAKNKNTYHATKLSTRFKWRIDDQYGKRR
ncbi:hypothetical protein SOASR015_36810 [Pectobacterium carotovorum subsp. carotovorum]|nr:hypothetical protein SOASR015_36810 [Pectobacterium carotovorum subsp. carotovorum]GLX58502.1 hypothetical protein Pcaca02_38110 [Pectobacterium carotovorum subsp. carotovorum]